jgi:hypothetical protein
LLKPIPLVYIVITTITTITSSKPLLIQSPKKPFVLQGEIKAHADRTGNVATTTSSKDVELLETASTAAWTQETGAITETASTAFSARNDIRDRNVREEAYWKIVIRGSDKDIDRISVRPESGRSIPSRALQELLKVIYLIAVMKIPKGWASVFFEIDYAPAKDSRHRRSRLSPGDSLDKIEGVLCIV